MNRHLQPIGEPIRMPDSALWSAMKDEADGVPGASERVWSMLLQKEAEYERNEARAEFIRENRHDR